MSKFPRIGQLYLSVAVAVLALSAPAYAKEPARGTMHFQACRLMKYQEATNQTLSEWWSASGVGEHVINLKLAYSRIAKDYFCEVDWEDGKPNGQTVAAIFRAFSTIDSWIIEEHAKQEGISLNFANRDKLTKSFNDMAAHFLTLRMNGCGGLIQEGNTTSIGDFLRGSNTSGIDIFGNEIASVSQGQVLPIALDRDSGFYDSRSVCKGGRSGGGGGGGVGATLSKGSAKGAASCYIDTMSAQTHCNEDGPAPALDIENAFMVPSWLARDGSGTKQSSSLDERTEVSANEHTRDTISLALATAYWIASVSAKSGLAYTATAGLAVTSVGLGVATIGLVVAGWAYYDKYYGDGFDRVRIRRDMCPMFSTPERGNFYMMSGILKGQPLSGVDVFAGCADVQCAGVLGLRGQCLDAQVRTDCQNNPQVMNERECVDVMQTGYEDEWNRQSLHSRFCSLVTCSDGQSAQMSGAGGCACAGTPSSSGGRPQLAYDPCWYSYCGDRYRVLSRTARIKWRARRFLRAP